MSVVFTGTLQGRFISTGVDKFIPLRQGVDYMYVQNETVAYAAGADTGAEFRWQLGDALGRGTIYTKTTTTNALTIGQIAALSGFYLYDNSINNPGALNNGSTGISAISTATPPRVTVGSTAGMATGNIVRIYNTAGATQLQGIDFTITLVSGTTFDLAYMATLGGAGTTGSFRVIPYNPYFYPSSRVITKISAQAVTGYAIVTLSVTHNYTVGQEVRFVVPTVDATHYGMTQLNGLQGSIVAINVADADAVTNTIVVDIDVSGFTAFAFPVTGSAGFSPAQIIPIGENTRTALDAVPQANILGDATENQAEIGMILKAGTGSPAGVNGNVIKWIAGKSWNI